MSSPALTWPVLALTAAIVAVLAGTIGGQMQDDRLVHGAGEELPLEPGAAGGVGDAGDGGLQVQLAPVTGDGLVAGEVEVEV